MNDRNALAKLLRRLAECIENSAAEDIDVLLTGQRYLRIEPGVPSLTRTSKSKRFTTIARNWSEIANQLRTLSSRDEGQRLIEGLSLTRTELEQLARAMDLPVSKQDNAERLREKIVEFSIGSRLVSQSVRGA